MPTIFQAQSTDDFILVRELLLEYLTWAIAQTKNEFGEDVDVKEMLNNTMSNLSNYMPPNGHLLLATLDGKAVGIIFLKGLREDTCEIKRMYVRPGYRGKHVGYKLLEHAITGARDHGYSKILLDSGRFMTHAHALYKSFGFKEVERYPESEMGAEFEKYMLYMKLDL